MAGVLSRKKVVLTYDDYVHLPDDGRRYEILEGELSVTPSPVTKHQRVSRNLLIPLARFVREHHLGEVLAAPMDVILSNVSVVQPDLLFVTRERSHLITEKNIQGAPDLIVEILSPTTASMDRTAKMQLYARYGVPHYWLVDPEAEALEAYELAEGAYELKADLSASADYYPAPFPGLVVPLKELWQ